MQTATFRRAAKPLLRAARILIAALFGIYAPIIAPMSASAQNPPPAATNNYVISGAAGANLTVDDDLDISLNGTQFYTDGNLLSGTRANINLQAKPGDNLTFVVRDTYGFCSSLTPLFLSCKGKSTFVQADPGFDLGCGRPSGNQGVVHTQNFTIPMSLSCPSTKIAAIEATQAIQQYQTLADLKASLNSSGEPPVPLVAGKPTVLRIYFAPVMDVTHVTVSLSGGITDSATVDLQPNCTPENQRANSSGCQSQDFYFTAPDGVWPVTVDLLDDSGKQIEEEILSFKSRTTNALRLRAVSVCDTQDVDGNWLCADARELISKYGLLTKIAPTNSVTLDVTSNVVQGDVSDTSIYPASDTWWEKVVKDVNGLYGRLDAGADLLTAGRTLYYGMVRASPTDGSADPLGGIGGIADGIPSHGAMGRTSALRFTSQVDTVVEVVAHEGAHTLGLKHTNTILPAVPAAPPGCYNFASDSTTDWSIYPDNKIQDSDILEYGFDVATHRILDPNTTFEVSSYCSPRWISPLHYKVMLATLGGGAVTSPSAIAGLHAQAVPAPSPFWIVGGTLTGSQPATRVVFDPLFQLSTQGDTTGGTGTYTLQVQNGAGTVLFKRLFTPSTPATETSRPDISGSPSFSEVLPVQPGATAIVLLGPDGIEVGRITLGGAPPTVTFTSPAAGFVASGAQTISWQVTGATAFSSLLLYSPDNGATWSQVAQSAKKPFTRVNFDKLPGGTQAILRVLVSDGVNTGSATSSPFAVARKKPSLVNIDTPANNYAQPAAAPIYLSGSVYDVDDGILKGSALQWTSDVQGALGIGSPLSVKLQPGTHQLTLTGTDSDGNALAASVSVLIGGGRPNVSLTSAALPGNCTGATINATSGAKGAALSRVQYSLDGGLTYTSLNLTALPYSLIVPGSGTVSLVARAYDQSSQSAAKSAQVTLSGTCTSGAPALSGGGVQNTNVGAAFASPLAVVVKDALGNPIGGVVVTFAVPASGASATPSATTATTGANGIASITVAANSTAGAYTVSASVPGFSTTVPFMLSNTDFTVAGDSTTLTVKHGSMVTSAFTITPLSGFASPTTFTCGNLPSGVTCTFSPATVTPSGGNVTSTLTINAAENARQTAALQLDEGRTATWLALCVCGLLFRRRARNVRLLLTLAIALLVSSVTGCGANFNPFSSNITVIATSGPLAHTSEIVLKVQ